MSGVDKAETLKALHKSRREETDRKALEAIDTLISEGKKVTYAAVAKRAGLTTATLYNHENLRKRIEQLRNEPVKRSHGAKTRSTEAAVIESLKRKVERLQKENEKLREENDRLKAAASKVYSDYLENI